MLWLAILLVFLGGQLVVLGATSFYAVRLVRSSLDALELRRSLGRLGFGPKGLRRFACRAGSLPFNVELASFTLDPSERARIRTGLAEIRHDTLKTVRVSFPIAGKVPADWTFHATVFQQHQINGSEAVAVVVLGKLASLKLSDGERVALTAFEEPPVLELELRRSRASTPAFQTSILVAESLSRNLASFSLPAALLEVATTSPGDELKATAAGLLVDEFPASTEARCLNESIDLQKSASVRFALARRLGVDGVTTMLALARDRRTPDHLREQSLLSIARMLPRHESVPVVLAALSDGSVSVAWSLLDEISRQRWTEALPALISFVPGSPDVTERLASTFADLRDPVAVPRLFALHAISQSRHHDDVSLERARIAVIDALARLGSNEIIPRLHALEATATFAERAAIGLAISTIRAKLPANEHGLALVASEGGELSVAAPDGALSTPEGSK